MKIMLIILCFIVCLSPGITQCTSTSIDSLKNKILETLCKKNPQYTPVFKDFFKRYDKTVVRFFDTHNDQPLMQEIKLLENELESLQKTCNDSRFTCIKNLLHTLYADLCSMINTLKEYSKSSNYVSFALSMRRFKPLLPEPILNKGDFSLFLSLKHRLAC